MTIKNEDKFTMVAKIMKSYLISSNLEAESAIEFVSELLEMEIASIIKNEPYATNSIRDLDVANQRVRDLLEVIYEKRMSE